MGGELHGNIVSEIALKLKSGHRVIDAPDARDAREIVEASIVRSFQPPEDLLGWMDERRKVVL
jgi:hypothetical protein